MPRIINKDMLEILPSYHLTKKATWAIKRAIELSGEDVHHEDYELYNITKHLIKIIQKKSTRVNMSIDTTMQVIQAIEFLKESNQI